MPCATFAFRRGDQIAEVMLPTTLPSTKTGHGSEQLGQGILPKTNPRIIFAHRWHGFPAIYFFQYTVSVHLSHRIFQNQSQMDYLQVSFHCHKKKGPPQFARLN